MQPKSVLACGPPAAGQPAPWCRHPAAYLWMVCPAGVCSTSSPACRRTSMTVLFPRK